MNQETSTQQSRPLAVVTGASSGIGLELAREFAEHNFDLVVAAEDSGILSVPAELGATGARVHPFRVDLSTYEGNEELYAFVRALDRPVAALALNAGIGVHGDFVRDTGLE